MAQAGVDELYVGTEEWDVANRFDDFIADFEDQSTRSDVLGSTDYSASPNISVFLSEETIKDLTGENGTLRTDIKGVVLLFGLDTGGNLVLIARSANGRSARPAGTDFNNFNYANPDNLILDSEVDALTANFRQNGYEVLQDWPQDDHPVIAFDNLTLVRLLYSDYNTNTAGQTDMHIVVAPPWEDDDSGKYISIVAKKDDVLRGVPNCPPYCYQNV